jgi:hypothetical protein
LTVGGRLPKHPSVSQLTSQPDSVLSKCRRSRHPIPTQIATAPLHEFKLTQKYWISYFTDLIIDRTWNEITKTKSGKESAK